MSVRVINVALIIDATHQACDDLRSLGGVEMLSGAALKRQTLEKH